MAVLSSVQGQEEGMEMQQQQPMGGGGEGMEGDTGDLAGSDGDGAGLATFAGEQIPYDEQ